MFGYIFVCKLGRMDAGEFVMLAAQILGVRVGEPLL